jgi:mono/diheme cytochrome c family protein
MAFATALATTAALLCTAQTKRPAQPASKPRSNTLVDYKKQVKPLLDSRCGACHGNGTKLGGFDMRTREGFLTGGTTGPAVKVGSSAESYLIKMVSGHVPGKLMPARGPRLTTKEVGLLAAWIDQGLKFGDVKEEAAWRPILSPRRVALSSVAPGSGLTNPVDRLVSEYFQIGKPKGAKVAKWPGLVDDRTYARRVYLDLIGMLPTPAELHAFLVDKRPDKRAQLAKMLLGDNRRYAEHWLTFWNDMLRNDYAGTGYIDGGRTQITNWLYSALVTNKPYDRFVAELINPTSESAGFVNGIVWRGVVNASQTPQMQASQNISQVFMGVNMKCASCHDSFINAWKLTDSYGMAAIYADGPLPVVRCDKPTGKTAQVKFMYPELGTIDGNAPKAQRIEQLAKVVTSKQNGRLARTLVNRLWQKLMGRGLVEPTDEMDNKPWDPDLLDWLSTDFADNGYDVKKTLYTIVTSRAYQLPVMSLKSELAENFVFRGPVVKRMQAEQFVDAVSSLTGVWQAPASQFRIAKGKPMLPMGGSAHVEFKSELMRSGAVEIDVDVTGAKVLSLMVTDGGNGGNFDWADWVNPRLEGPRGTLKLTELPWRSGTTGYGKIQINKSVVEKPLRLGDKSYTEGIGTHANSIITWVIPEGYTRFKATAGPDQGGIESQGSETSVELYVVTGDLSLLKSRASLAVADPLMRALGRPNREQVVTERSPVATTLQAIELTNGRTLASMLEQGAEKWSKEAKSADDVVGRLYEYALGRPPTPAEGQMAKEVVGEPVRKEGVEDLLWSLVMLPEFQLVY